MKKILPLILLAMFIAMPSAYAGTSGNHYVNGVEGIKGASLPPAGIYYRMYNAVYASDEIKDIDGNEVDLQPHISVMAQVHRVVWISNKKILGADFGMDMLVPIQQANVEFDHTGYEDNHLRVGDINIEPLLLGWHGKRWDATFGFSIFMPTGDWDKDEQALPGKNYWTYMFTLGSTVYLDKAKTWSASVLARYEIHSDNDKIHIRPGNDFHFEWGVSKNINKVWEVGVAGYCQWQVTNDKGTGVNYDADDHDRVFAIGPEIAYTVPKWKSIFSMRLLWEFDARDRTEGAVGVLSWTKAF